MVGQGTGEEGNAVIDQHVGSLGINTLDQAMVGCCKMMVFNFIFFCRSVKVVHVGVDNMVVYEEFVWVRFTHRTENKTYRPFLLMYQRRT